MAPSTEIIDLASSDDEAPLAHRASPMAPLPAGRIQSSSHPLRTTVDMQHRPSRMEIPQPRHRGTTIQAPIVIDGQPGVSSRTLKTNRHQGQHMPLTSPSRSATAHAFSTTSINGTKRKDPFDNVFGQPEIAKKRRLSGDRSVQKIESRGAQLLKHPPRVSQELRSIDLTSQSSEPKDRTALPSRQSLSARPSQISQQTSNPRPREPYLPFPGAEGRTVSSIERTASAGSQKLDPEHRFTAIEDSRFSRSPASKSVLPGSTGTPTALETSHGPRSLVSDEHERRSTIPESPPRSPGPFDSQTRSSAGPTNGFATKLGSKNQAGTETQESHMENTDAEPQNQKLLSGPEKGAAFDPSDRPSEPVLTPLTDAIDSHPVGTSAAPTSIAAPMDTLREAERIVGKSLEAMRSDNEYWGRFWLKQARVSVENRRLPLQDEKPTSVFSKLRPIPLEPVVHNSASLSKGMNDFGELLVEHANTKTSIVRAKRTLISSDDTDVPPYSHYVSIETNFPAHNEKSLQNLPYFGDDFNMDDALGLRAHFYMDVDSRQRKLLRLGEAENWAPYADHMLDEAGCNWSDVLHFLLEPNPDVGVKPEPLLALEHRAKLCDEDFVRGGRRWTAVLSRLPPATPENVGRAALLCEQFQRMTKFSLWHLVRRSPYTRRLLQKNDDQQSSDELTCRICMRFSCPYHGEINDGSSRSDGEDDEAEVETDIIHPPVVNFRTRVKLPLTVDDEELMAQPKDRRNIDYWQKGSYSNLRHRLDERGPFYPCYHPGISCETAGDDCSCNRDKLVCEKICACPPSCLRKFQGCSCASTSTEKKSKTSKLVCFESEKCVCFQLGRECDPDLCGNCGVYDVVDPLHRHQDDIMEGRCRNANLQRRFPKHTILGDSGVHGLGLYACEDIREHDFVGEYRGEIITKDEAERRGAVYEHQKLSYLFSLNDKQEIDSTYFGNRTRFINHANKPHCNVYARIIMVNTIHRIALYGSRTIKAGEELFYDYGPMFPHEQLGGSGKTAKKTVPRVRNSDLVHQFWEVEQTKDKHGNRRAVKKPSGTHDTDVNDEKADADVRPKMLAKKSARSLPRKRPSRSRAVRPSKKHSRILEEPNGDHQPSTHPLDVGGDDQMKDAGHRLFDLTGLGDTDDEDFEPDDDLETSSEGDEDGVEIRRRAHELRSRRLG